MSESPAESPQQEPTANLARFECVTCAVTVFWPPDTDREPACLRCRVQMQRVSEF